MVAVQPGPARGPRIPVEPWRFVAFAVIVGALFGAAYVAGVRGAFTSNGRSLCQRLGDPNSRLAATVDLAEQIAVVAGDGLPMLDGARDERTCPDPVHATEAVKLIGSIDDVSAAATVRRARARLGSAGWTLTSASDAATVTARNRRGVTASVGRVGGSASSAVEVRVTVPCPPSESSSPARP